MQIVNAINNRHILFIAIFLIFLIFFFIIGFAIKLLLDVMQINAARQYVCIFPGISLLSHILHVTFHTMFLFSTNFPSPEWPVLKF